MLAVALLLAGVLVPSGPGTALAEAAAAPRGDLYSVGLFDPARSRWYFRDPEGGTTALTFGEDGDVPLAGDWDGDGVDTPGVYRPAEGRLVVRNGSEPISYVYAMPTGGLPVVADTDGDGRDTVSIGRFGRLYIMDGLGSGPASLDGPDPLPISLPAGTDQLVGGDFDGDGADEIAAVHQGVVEMVGPGRSAILGEVGPALAVAGDWNGDGVDTLGAYDTWQSEFVLFGVGAAAAGALEYGSTGMLPVAGRFGGLPGDDDAPPHHSGVPALAEGDQGAMVVALQRELARRHLYRGPLDGEFGPATAYAAVTFHKVMGLERTFAWEEEDSAHMADFALPPLPDRPEEPNRVEVDIGRQVLFLFEDGEVAEMVPISSGGTYRYYSERQGTWVWAGTPRGDYTFIRHSLGWNCDPLTGWCIYNPWNFTPYYALHGYRSVPAQPASHGCVRIPTWESDILDGRFHIGMPIHLWDEYPAEDG
jgi:peptidoglycan hydrolase-like protein with peptidoglycan-binding domain